VCTALLKQARREALLSWRSMHNVLLELEACAFPTSTLASMLLLPDLMYYCRPRCCLSMYVQPRCALMLLLTTLPTALAGQRRVQAQQWAGPARPRVTQQPGQQAWGTQPAAMMWIFGRSLAAAQVRRLYACRLEQVV
jgi:hypothetical protein